jgi:GNAT superfamily N-acetyltransferase
MANPPQEFGEPFIRPVDYPKDKSALDIIFRTTCNPSLQHEPQWTISSYLWCHPYPLLNPETCFVLSSGFNSDNAVGYILCTPDTRSFAARWTPEFLPQVDQRLCPRPPDYEAEGRQPSTWASDLPGFLLHMMYNDPVNLLNGSYPDLLDEYPAHLHIDLLASYQRQGWGKKMIDHLLAELKARGVKGVHLGMESFNVGAGKFYERLGFKRFPRVLSEDPKIEGRQGETASVIYLVKDLS